MVSEPSDETQKTTSKAWLINREFFRYEFEHFNMSIKAFKTKIEIEYFRYSVNIKNPNFLEENFKFWPKTSICYNQIFNHSLSSNIQENSIMFQK